MARFSIQSTVLAESVVGTNDCLGMQVCRSLVHFSIKMPRYAYLLCKLIVMPHKNVISMSIVFAIERRNG